MVDVAGSNMQRDGETEIRKFGMLIGSMGGVVVVEYIKPIDPEQASCLHTCTELT
jgi:hypothetical protein